MKKLILSLCLLSSGYIFSQNITWQNITLNVPNENSQAVENLIDGFYSNIQIPEGVRVSLWNIQFKGASEKATHVLNLALYKYKYTWIISGLFAGLILDLIIYFLFLDIYKIEE